MRCVVVARFTSSLWSHAPWLLEPLAAGSLALSWRERPALELEGGKEKKEKKRSWTNLMEKLRRLRHRHPGQLAART